MVIYSIKKTCMQIVVFTVDRLNFKKLPYTVAYNRGVKRLIYDKPIGYGLTTPWYPIFRTFLKIRRCLNDNFRVAAITIVKWNLRAAKKKNEMA